MPASNGADDVTPGPSVDDAVRDPANRELVVFLGNMTLEMRHNYTTLQGLYKLLRDMTGRPPIEWQHQLVTSQEGHVERVNDHVTGLKAALGVG